MKCDNCGAPLTLLNGRDYFYCDYCATFHYPPAADASDNDIAPLGERTEMPCPICRVNLSAGRLEGRRVAFCETCRGVFVSNDDFSDIIQAQRGRYTGPTDKPVPVNPGELNRRLDCPACGKPALQKLVSAAGFRLKGGGWYETDFKAGKKKNIAKSDSSSKSEKKSDSGTKTSSGSSKKAG